MSSFRDACKRTIVILTVVLVSACAWSAQEPLAKPAAMKRNPNAAVGRSQTTSDDAGADTTRCDYLGRVHKAEQLSQLGRHREVLELLAGVPEAVTHWEYGFLNSRARGRACFEAFTFSQLRGRILAATFSPDGRLLAAAGTGTSIYIYDPATGVLVRTIPIRPTWIRCLKFAPDGSYLAGSSEDGYVRFWSIQTGAELRHVPKQYRAVRGIAFSPDGTAIATAGLDGSVKLWSLPEARETIRTCEGHTNGAGAVTFSPDGTKLASMSLHGEIFLWDASTGRQLQALGDPVSLETASIAFSPDGRLLAAAYPGAAVIWDLRTGEKVRTLGRALNGEPEVAFTPDGRCLITARDHTVRVWEVSTGRPLCRMTGRTGPIYAMAPSPDGARLVTGGTGEVKVFSTGVGDATRVVGHISERASCVAFTPDSAHVMAGGPIEHKTWELESGAEYAVEGQIEHTLAFSGDGKLVAVVNNQHEVIIRERDTGEAVRYFRGHNKRVLTAVFTRSNKRVITAGWDRSVRLWDIPSGKAMWKRTGLPAQIVSLAMSPAGRYVAAAVSGQFIQVYDIRGGKEVRRIKMSGSSLAYGKTGLLAAAGDDGVIRLWQPVKGEPRGELRGHEDRISALAFSTDGLRLASGGADGTIRIWDPLERRELVTLDVGKVWVRAVAFSPDQEHLAAGDEDGNVHVWERSRVWSTAENAWIRASDIVIHTSNARATPNAKTEHQRQGADSPQPVPLPEE